MLSSGPEKLELLVTAELCSFVPSREAQWRCKNRSASSISVALVKAWLQVQMLPIDFLHSIDLLGPKIR